MVASQHTRLLRWYPSAWREQYGEEFVDHLEQEFADRPVDIKRSANIAFKGLAARVADVGLSKGEVIAGGQRRAAVGTTFVLSALMVALALNFWSRAMSLWGERRYHPVPDSVVTGILTVAIGLLLAILVAIVLTVAVCVVRQIVRGHLWCLRFLPWARVHFFFTTCAGCPRGCGPVCARH